MKKRIIVIGWTLFGILFAGLFAIAVTAVLQGEGMTPWKLVRGGRGGVVFSVTLLPIFLVLIAFGGFWIKRRFFRRAKESKAMARSPR